MKSRNEEVREILRAREIAKQQNAEMRVKARVQVLDPENLYIKNACWPSALRVEKVQ